MITMMTITTIPPNTATITMVRTPSNPVGVVFVPVVVVSVDVMEVDVGDVVVVGGLSLIWITHLIERVYDLMP